ncbi:RICIN domain-containing protein [Streptomyces sp. NPDC005931]|uniref:RICIN domain-containing protein n=1 Tax=Streptomyces sp. NPDC005931 TaxID=3364737 RepID=UPI0036AA5EFC
MRSHKIFTAAAVGVAQLTLTLALAPTPAAAATAGPYWWASAAVSDLNRMVLDVQGPSTAEYAKVHLWDFYGGTSQYWYLDTATGQPSNVRLLRNRYSGKCIDPQGTGITNGTAVVQETCNHGDRRQMWRQEFRFSGAGHSYYRFVNVATGKCLDNANGSSANGNKIQLWSCASGTNYNQLWY